MAKRLDYRVVGDSDPQGLEVVTTQGQTYGLDVNPANNTVDSTHTDEIVAKFRDSASWSVNRLNAAAIEELVETVMHLEELDNVAKLPEIASRGSRGA